MNRNYASPLPVKEYAAMCGVSPSYFTHLFTEKLGMPPHRYQLSVRLQMARELLRDTSLNVSQVAYETGFSDPLYFSRIYKQYFGAAPTKQK